MKRWLAYQVALAALSAFVEGESNVEGFPVAFVNAYQGYTNAQTKKFVFQKSA